MSFKESYYVDTTETNYLSLCTGYGGIDLGLRRAIPNLRTIAYSEIEAFACANLVSKMEAGLLDPAPIWTDIKTFPFSDFYGKVDILSGGYPCQPFSSAGKRLGSDDPRHLWPFIAKGVAICRPKTCFFENVEGHISLGLSTVLSDLEEMGYKVSWGIFSASEVGAPHQRKRVFILAQLPYSKHLPRSTEQGFKHQEWPKEYLRGNRLADSNCCRSGKDTEQKELRTNCVEQPSSNSGRVDQRENEKSCCENPRLPDCHGKGLQRLWRHERIYDSSRWQTKDGYSWPSRPGEQQYAWEPARVVAYTKSKRTQQRPEFCTEERRSGVSLPRVAGQAGKSEPPEYRQAQPQMGRNADGPADWLGDAELYSACDNRVDELRLLGNGVVPQTAEKAFLTLLQGEQ